VGRPILVDNEECVAEAKKQFWDGYEAGRLATFDWMRTHLTQLDAAIRNEQDEAEIPF
jgi:hypothetical protein